MIEPPYITAWTGEVGYVVRPAPILGGTPALFARTGRRRQGAPIWGKISEERQRECAVRRLCQVCHRPLRLALGPGYSLVPLKVVQHAGTTQGMTHEPLVCRPCLPVVLRSCPAIRRMAAFDLLDAEHGVEQDPLVGLAVSAYDIAVQMIGPVYPPPDAVSVEINEALREVGYRPAAAMAELVMTRFEATPIAALFGLAGLERP